MSEPLPILNIAEVPLRDLAHGQRYESKLGRIGGRIGARQLGCQLHIVPPGKTAFPFHAHHSNEEMFFIVEGHGTLRLGDARHSIRAGDVISAPAGDAATAHQIVNSSDVELRYLGFSTRHDPDVVEYPDSGKFGVASLVPRDGGSASARIFHLARPGTSLDYWDGES